MQSHEALLAGATIGLTVAAPVGPMAIIIIHRTLANGFSAGLATGAGASTTHLVYTTLALLGLNQFSDLVAAHRIELRALSAALLIMFAVRSLRRFARSQSADRPVRQSLFANYASAIALNCVNPLGFILFLGSIGAVTGFAREGGTSAYGLAAGVFVGSIGWWVVLVGATATVGLRLSPTKMRFIDLAAASMLALLAASMIARLF